MKNLKYIENQKPVAEVQYLKEKELTDKEIAEQWIKSIYLDPNAKFNGDREVWCSSCSVGDPGYGKTFSLSLNLRNATGGHREGDVYSVDDARNESQRILSGDGRWAGGPNNGGIYRRKNREDLVDKINSRIRNHIREGGEYINETVTNSVSNATNQGLDNVINCRIA